MRANLRRIPGIVWCALGTELFLACVAAFVIFKDQGVL